MSNQELGKKVINIYDLVDRFTAQEGVIEHIIGKTGNGKTYEATRRALEYLQKGYTVYTTWRLLLPDFYDEREDREKLFFKLLFFDKTFCRFDYKNNWHYLDIDRPDLVEFVAGLTDCVVFLDEGQDIFDSYSGIGMSQTKRKSLTRTRHMRKTLIIVSQRASAVHITARANVQFYYKCVKTWAWWWPFAQYFKVYRTEEQDNANLPIWEDGITGWTAELWKSHFANSNVYNAYNSWYLRAGIPNSQEIKFEAFELNTWEKIKGLFSKINKKFIGPSDQETKKLEEENFRKYKEITTFEEKKKTKTYKKSIPKNDELSTGLSTDVIFSPADNKAVQ